MQNSILEEGKKNLVLVVSLIVLLLIIGGVVAFFLSTPSLEPPTGLKATVKEGVVYLKWEAPPTVVDGYKVYRKYKGKEILIAEVSSPSFVDKTVEEGEEYSYRVSSYKGNDESVKSSSVVVYVSPIPPQDVEFKVLNSCTAEGTVISFKAKNADGCSFSFDGKEWIDYRLEDSPVKLPSYALLGEGQKKVYGKCFRVVKGKKIETEKVEMVVDNYQTPLQLYGDVNVEGSKAYISVSSNRKIESCAVFAGENYLGSFNGSSAVFDLIAGKYNLVVSCRDSCGSSAYFAKPVEVNEMNFEVGNKSYELSLLINGGDSYTNSINVVLDVVAKNFSECRFANEVDKASGIWTTWESAFTGEKEWTLSSCGGVRTVYMQCRDENNSYVVSDSILCTRYGGENGTINETNESFFPEMMAQIYGEGEDVSILEDSSVLFKPDLRLGGAFVWKYGGTCNLRETSYNVVKTNVWKPSKGKTNRVKLIFPSAVDGVNVYENGILIYSSNDSRREYVFELPSIYTSIDGVERRELHVQAYRVVDNQRFVVFEGERQITLYKSPPSVEVVCDGNNIRITLDRELQAVLIKKGVRACWDDALMDRGYNTYVGEDGQYLVEIWDEVGNNVVREVNCAADSSADFEVYGSIDRCEPVGNSIVCSEDYELGLAKRASAKLKVLSPMSCARAEGFYFDGMSFGCDSAFRQGSILFGKLTTLVMANSEFEHEVSLYPDNSSTPSTVSVLVDNKPPTIRGIECNDRGSDGIVCTVYADDRSGVRAYEWDVCYSIAYPITDPIPNPNPIPQLAVEEGGGVLPIENSCDGVSVKRASYSPTIRLEKRPRYNYVRLDVKAYDMAGNSNSYRHYQLINESALQPSVSVDVKGLITYNRLQPSVEFVRGGNIVIPEVVQREDENDEYSRTTTLKLYTETVYADEYKIEGSVLSSAIWLPMPLPDVVDVGGEGFKTITVYVRNAYGVDSSSDNIVVDLTPPSLSAVCGVEGTKVVCDYSAVDTGPFYFSSSSTVRDVQAYLVVEDVETGFEYVRGSVRVLPPSGRVEFDLSADDDGKRARVVMLAQDLAGNYVLEDFNAGIINYPVLEVNLTNVEIGRVVGSPLLASVAIPNVPNFIPVEITNNSKSLVVKIEAENAEECGLCLNSGGISTVACSPSRWNPYSIYTPLDIPNTEGNYHVTVVCRNGTVYSNQLSDSVVVDLTPPSLSLRASLKSVVVRVDERYQSTLSKGEDVFIDEKLDNVYLAPPDACIPTSWEPINYNTNNGFLAYVKGYLAVPIPYDSSVPFLNNTRTYCSVSFTNGTQSISLPCYATKDLDSQCSAEGYVTMRGEFTTSVNDTQLSEICTALGGSLTFEGSYKISYKYDVDLEPISTSNSYVLNNVVNCSSYRVNETYVGNIELRVGASDNVMIDSIVLYRQEGRLREGRIQPVGSFEQITFSSTPFVYHDNVIFDSNSSIAEEGWRFYRYKVVAYDKAGNSAVTYSDWIAPYSISGGIGVGGGSVTPGGGFGIGSSER